MSVAAVAVSMFTLSLVAGAAPLGLRGSWLPGEESCSSALSSLQSFIHYQLRSMTWSLAAVIWHQVTLLFSPCVTDNHDCCFKNIQNTLSLLIFQLPFSCLCCWCVSQNCNGFVACSAIFFFSCHRELQGCLTVPISYTIWTTFCGVSFF